MSFLGCHKTLKNVVFRLWNQANLWIFCKVFSFCIAFWRSSSSRQKYLPLKLVPEFLKHAPVDTEATLLVHAGERTAQKSYQYSFSTLSTAYPLAFGRVITVGQVEFLLSHKALLTAFKTIVTGLGQVLKGHLSLFIKLTGNLTFFTETDLVKLASKSDHICTFVHSYHEMLHFSFFFLQCWQEQYSGQ